MHVTCYCYTCIYNTLNKLFCRVYSIWSWTLYFSPLIYVWNKNFVGMKPINNTHNDRIIVIKRCFVVSVESVDFGYFNEYESFLAHINKNRLTKTHYHTHKFKWSTSYDVFQPKKKILFCVVDFGLMKIFLYLITQHKQSIVMNRTTCTLQSQWSTLEIRTIDEFNQIKFINFKIVRLFPTLMEFDY